MHLAVGDVDAAEEHTTAARARFVAIGREAEAVLALHNQGVVAYVKGDLPAALAIYDRSEDAVRRARHRRGNARHRPFDGLAERRAGG